MLPQPNVYCNWVIVSRIATVVPPASHIYAFAYSQCMGVVKSVTHFVSQKLIANMAVTQESTIGVSSVIAFVVSIDLYSYHAGHIVQYCTHARCSDDTDFIELHLFFFSQFQYTQRLVMHLSGSHQLVQKQVIASRWNIQLVYTGLRSKGH